MRLISRYFFAGFLISLILSGCVKQIRPTTETVLKKDTTLEALVALYRKRLEGFRGIKALMEVKADLGDRGKHTIQTAWRSDRNEIQLRGFDLFGGTLFELYLNGSSFSLKLPSDQKAFEGDLDFFEEVAGDQIPFGSRGLLDWIQRGGLPDLSFPIVPVLEKRADRFILYLFMVGQGSGVLREKVWIERTAFRIKKVEQFDPSGFQRSMLILDDYRTVAGREFPFSVIAIDHKQGIGKGKEIELKFREVSFPQTGLP